MEIIVKNENDMVEVNFIPTVEDEKITFNDVFATLVKTIEVATKKFLDDSKAAHEEREETYDRMDEVFSYCLHEVFPEINPHEFDLSDAAIVKAQDDIIKEAEAEGITFQEALEKYNILAKEYVQARKMS